VKKHTKQSRRNFLRATGSAATAVALAGCSGSGGQETTTTAETSDPTETDAEDTTQSEQEEPARRLELITTGVRTLDTVPQTTSTDSAVIVNIFDGLTNYYHGQAEVRSHLAADYQISDDDRTYTFTLKDGVSFHNDATLTADDVVYSFERLAASENSARGHYILDTLGVEHETETTTQDGEETEVYSPGTLAVSAVDERTVEITLQEPFHAALQMLAFSPFSVLPEGIVDDVPNYDGEITQSEFATNPVGCGPFTFEKHEQDAEIVLSAFDDYHGDGPHVSGVRWRSISDEEAQFTYATNKNADIFELPNAHYDPAKVSVEETDDQGRDVGTYGPLRNDETVDYLRVPTITSSYLGFNTERIPRAPRRAIAYAVDQQLITEEVFKGRYVPAYHFTPPSIYPGGADAYDDHAENNYPYGYNESRLDEARRVMEEAGYGEGERFEFTLLVYTDAWRSIGQLIRDQMSSAYMDVQLERLEFSALAGRLLNGNIDAYGLGWAFDWPAPDNFLQLLYPPNTDTSADGNVGFTNWGGTEAADRAANAWENQVQANVGPGEEAQQARNEGYVAIEEANWTDVIQLPMFHESQEMFSYPWVEYPKFGGGGFGQLKKNEFRFVGERE
jgi:peptide/nickel transport system substrate-binding protein